MVRTVSFKVHTLLKKVLLLSPDYMVLFEIYRHKIEAMMATICWAPTMYLELDKNKLTDLPRNLKAGWALSFF